MGWLARLFGREQPASQIQTPTGHETSTHDVTSPLSPLSTSGLFDGLQQPLQTVMEHAIAPTLAELHDIRQRLDALLGSRPSPPVQTTTVSPNANSTTMDTESLERAIEYALAHFYRLLRGREELKVPAAMLGKTPDGNTHLPLDPKLQHLLVVMHPLYPHLYTTLIVLPGTFTSVHELHELPNGVQTYALHINTRKAPPGFIDALTTLHAQNWENLFLGRLTAAEDGMHSHTLQYFRCTGSDIRNPAPEKYPDQKMMYFNGKPEPFIFRQNLAGTEEIFSALEVLEQEAAARDASPLQGEQPYA